MTPPTVISDPKLRELYEALGETGHSTNVDAMIRADEAFILALNAKLQAAEKMAEAFNALDIELREAWGLGILPGSVLTTKTIERYVSALAAYRSLSPEQQEDAPQDLDRLHAERATVQQMLNEAGENDPMGRMSLQGRLDQIDEELGSAPRLATHKDGV